jgi:uncharacterized protein (TIGR00297 family)
MGLFAVALRWLPAWGAALLAGFAVAMNVALLPRLAPGLFRRREEGRRFSSGIALYPLAVLFLVLAFHDRLHFAALLWGVLAFGDGPATLAGRAIGGARLPWNRDKSWAGSAAYFVVGGTAGALLLAWVAGATAPGEFSIGAVCAIAFATALLGALVESVPIGLDDNVSVPLLGALFVNGIALVDAGRLEALGPLAAARLVLALGLNALLGALAFAGRSVNASGLVMGILMGAAIYVFLGPPGFAVLLLFFVLGSGASKLGYKRKAAKGLAQEAGGRRGAKHAVANAGAGLMLAFLAAATPHEPLFALAFVAAFATAAADTVSSEIGQLIGKHPFLITTLRPVPAGTEGAVSVEGTVAGIAASAVVGSAACALGLVSPAGIVVVVSAAFVGTTLESVLGATIERLGLLDNEAVNFANTLIGALAAILIALPFSF